MYSKVYTVYLIKPIAIPIVNGNSGRRYAMLQVGE